MEPSGANNISSLNKESVHQLAPVKAFMKADGIDLEEPPSELRLRMVSIVEMDITASRTYKQIPGMLTKLGFIYENEVPPLEAWAMGGMLAIDMACAKQKIAIEFDGPSHYLKSAGIGDMTQVEKHAKRFVKEGNPQDIANTVWAFAVLGFESPTLFASIWRIYYRIQMLLRVSAEW